MRVLVLGSGVVGTVLPLQFWMMAGQLFSISQGKRLFGPIAAGGVLGAAVGGGVAAVGLELGRQLLDVRCGVRRQGA